MQARASDLLASLTDSHVPNYTVSASAAGALLFTSAVSALQGATFTSRLSLLLSVASGVMAANQYGWDKSKDVAAKVAGVAKDGITQAVMTGFDYAKKNGSNPFSLFKLHERPGQMVRDSSPEPIELTRTSPSSSGSSSDDESSAPARPKMN